MGEVSHADFGVIVNRYQPDLKEYEEAYKKIHKDPELSRKETKTATIAAEHLKKLDFEVHEKIGGHGIVGLFRNGHGRTVLLRADMDALPVREQTGLPYASVKHMEDKDGNLKPAMHACGHDMHVAMLMAVSTLLKSARGEWSGNLIALFQPDEETAGGAKAMVDDGLYERFGLPIPDFVLGQHLAGRIKGGVVSLGAGPMLTVVDHLDVTIPGVGGHSSAPQGCVDPIVIASQIIVRLQTIVSREIDPADFAVVSCGSFHGGEVANVIPDHVTLKLDIRAYRPQVRDTLMRCVKRIVDAECEASGTPQKPTIKALLRTPPLINDEVLVKLLSQPLSQHFGEDFQVMKPGSAGEDISNLATPKQIPYAYWWLGCVDPKEWDEAVKNDKILKLSSNHSPFFAPAIEPTMKTGVEAFAIAALACLT